jgi:hypothetical protein
MIDRVKVNALLDVVEKLEKEDAFLNITGRAIALTVYPCNWWDGATWSKERRHEVLSIVTPIVGKMEKEESNGLIGYSGKKDEVRIYLYRVSACTILGYKKEIKKIKKEIVAAQYEEVCEEVETPITDCDILKGKFAETDIDKRY